MYYKMSKLTIEVYLDLKGAGRRNERSDFWFDVDG